METSRELIVSFQTGEQGELLFHSIAAPDVALDAIAGVLQGSSVAKAAFIKNAARVPDLNIARASAPVSTATPSFRNQQGYLDAAPGGVNVPAVTGVAGGGGAGVRVFDGEEDWEMRHEDRPVNFLGLVSGEPLPSVDADQDHGTAVMGVIAAADNGFGVTGIAPDAAVGLVRFKPLLVDSSNTILTAVKDQNMKAGDILVLPLDRPGPRGNSIAIEWWPDDFAAIRHATDQGVIVVAAAGNGGDDLDHPDYDTPLAGFQPAWRNPFRRGAMDSGAILVGAGIPPNSGEPDRSRHGDSNFGTAVDVQGWASAIFTTGYGDQERGNDTTRFYTSNFGMTSGSTAMIAGVLACVQGARIAAGKNPWTPSEARNALRATGSPQQASATSPIAERIGNRPNLAELIALALA